ncbi:MAG: ATP-binding cassette domain-containing protein [Planctomycetes bacterium]|nr:ATP-binding cassette domain-containing protein [Planctomycetota bacterium]
MTNFWRYAKIMLEYRKLVTLAIIGMLIDASCQLGGFGSLTWVVRQFIEDNTTIHDILEQKLTALNTQWHVDVLWVMAYVPKDAWWGLAMTLGGILVLAVIGSCGRFLHEFSTITMGLNTVMRLRKKVFTRLVHLPMAVASQEKTAEQASRVVRDCEGLGRGFNAITAKSLRGITVGIVLLIGAFIMDWKLTLIFLVVLPIMGVMIRKFSKRIRRASKRALLQFGVMLGALTESMQGLRVVKVHQAEGYERRRFNVINRTVLAHQMKARTARALSSPIVETLSMVGLVMVVLIAAWSVFEQGKPTYTLVGVIVMLAGSANSFKQLNGLNNTLQEAAAAADNITEVLHFPVENPPQGRMHLPRLATHKQSVAFEQVTFAYPGTTRKVLRDVSLEVPHGSICAIVGSNGSGKSTLLSLLPRLYDPDAGRILIDGTDIAKCTLKSVRKQIAMVTQDTVLFDGTIAQNISYGLRSADREAVIEAAKRAHAHAFICAMPDGYDAPIGERGQRLSGGQRQRIAIARAILRNPPILILDEATSQIDTESEAQITAALAEFVKDRTTFVIAHRLSTVVNAHKIVVMADGVIASVGTHAELLKTSDIYRVLCQTQLHGLDTASA